jgi:hypothetical protein
MRSAHIQRKFYFYLSKSGQTVVCPDLHFHKKGRNQAPHFSISALFVKKQLGKIRRFFRVANFKITFRYRCAERTRRAFQWLHLIPGYDTIQVLECLLNGGFFP